MDAGMSECPVCGREWLVTPYDDCLMPSCGCYGRETGPENPKRLCSNCGMKHGWNMPESCACVAVGRFFAAIVGEPGSAEVNTELEADDRVNPDLGG